MKIIPKHTIEDIRARSDIVEVVGSYLPLKRSGSSWKTNCPFHKEKTPSFHVNPQRQIYHCFGCGAGGDVFRFLQEHEAVDFVTAVKILGDRVGIRIDLEEDAGQRDGINKDVLFRIHDDAAMLFHRVLKEKLGAQVARDYLERRQLDEKAVGEFLIGYAPERSDAMTKMAEKKGYTMEQIEKAGLAIKTEKKGKDGTPIYRDRFWSRLMFPIRNELGKIIGFSGRILVDTKRAAKYVNSPDTPLFRKSKVLFALDKAKRSIAETRIAIVCEGQIDAIRCHVAGINNVCASQGTALTEEHAAVLKRYADAVVLVLDADKAGQNAALRSMEHFMGAGLSLNVAALPKGEDPDSLILKHGPEALEDLVDKAVPALDFQIDVLQSREDLQTEAGLMRAVRSLLGTVAKAPSAVMRDQFIKKISERLHVSESALREDLRRETRRTYSRSTSAPSEDEPKQRARHPVEEVTLCELLAAHPEVAGLFRTYLPTDTLTDRSCRTIVERLLEHSADEAWSLVADLSGEDEEALRLAAQIQMDPRKISGDEVSPETAAQDVILAIRRKAKERERELHRERLKQVTGAEQEQIEDECKALTIEISKLKGAWEAALPILDL